MALRAEPTTDSEIIAILGYHIISLDRSQSIQAGTGHRQLVWAIAATTGGQEGYVAAQYVRRPADHCAFFENQAGTWKMTFLAAGD